MKNYGLGNALKCRPTLAELQKFVAGIKEEDGHWLWVGSKNEHGYGHIWFNGKWEYAHRVSFALFRGRLREAEDVHHKCKKRHCLYPWHLKKKGHVEHTIEHNEERVPF